MPVGSSSDAPVTSPGRIARRYSRQTGPTVGFVRSSSEPFADSSLESGSASWGRASVAINRSVPTGEDFEPRFPADPILRRFLSTCVQGAVWIGSTVGYGSLNGTPEGSPFVLIGAAGFGPRRLLERTN